MQRCLELAKNGLGLVYPNPMVGCVIVYQDRIIGEGWHQKAGCPHAEVNAIDSVKDKSLLTKATLYVNLEPCSHHGRTPPCADLIIEYGIKKVIIGSVDTHEKVGGKGIKRLRENGVEVEISILESEGRELNKRFFTFHEKKRPYVILKWAQSVDGFIFPAASGVEKGIPYWISNSYSLQRVHQWRSEEAAILVGRKTVQLDNPRLNIRDYTGNSILRIAIDRKLELNGSLNFFDGSNDTIIYNELKDEERGKSHFVQLDFSKDLVAQMMQHLHDIEIQSLIVEGGAYTLNAFIRSGSWDEARVFQGEQHFGDGLEAPVLHADRISEEHLGNNLLYIYKNSKDEK